MVDFGTTGKYTKEKSLGVFVRPYCLEFLKRLHQYYILAIFTASTQPYCDAIMEKLDPECLVTHRFYRDHCTQINSKRPLYLIFVTMFKTTM